MRPPNEVVLDKKEMDVLIFIIEDRLELLNDLKKGKDFEEDDEKEELTLIRLLDRFKKAGLKWKKQDDGTYETTLPGGNQLIRVES